jgi:hypothetical protein
MSIVNFQKETEEWLFQHDNDPKHTNMQQSCNHNTTVKFTILQNESYQTPMEQSGPTPPTL